MRGLGVLPGVLVLASWCLVGGCGKEEPRPVPSSEKTQKASKPADQAESPSPASKPTGVSTTRAAKTKRQGESLEAGKAPAPAEAGKARPRRGGPMRLGESRRTESGGVAPRPRSKAGQKRFPKRLTDVQMPDQLFYCSECKKSFTLTYQETRDRFRKMERTSGGVTHRALTCPECDKPTATPARKCPKCGEIVAALKTLPRDKSGGGRPRFLDECPKCGYSRIREHVLDGIQRQMERGTFNPERLGGLQRRAIEDAKARGEWTDPKP